AAGNSDPPTPISPQVTSACEGASGPLAVAAYDDLGHVIASRYVPLAPYTGASTVPAGDWVGNAIGDLALTVTGLDPAATFVGFQGVAVYPGAMTFVDQAGLVPIG